MRTFPSAVSGRVVTALPSLVVTLLTLALLVPSAVAAPVPVADPEGKSKLQQQQRRVERAQRGAHRSLDESSAQVRRAAVRLTGSRARLAGARTTLTTARSAVGTARAADAAAAADLRAAEAALTRAQDALVAGRRAVTAQHRSVVDTVTGYYEQGDPQLLALTALMDAQTPVDVTRRLSLMNTVVSGQTRTWTDLQAAEVALEARKRAVDTARDAVADRRRAAADQLARTTAAERSAAAAAGGVRAAVGANASAVAEARRAKRADLRELRRLARREASIKRRILAAARRDAAAHRSAYDGDTGGVLLRPVAGPVTSPYGYRIHPIYGYWGLHDGVDLGAGCGTPLKAVAGGTVLSEYYSSSWGNRLYLNLGSYNGRNVTVVYNHLSGYRAHSGQRVARGETIGYVGTTGWSTGCHLHFTVLVDGTAVDPMGWIS